MKVLKPQLFFGKFYSYSSVEYEFLQAFSQEPNDTVLKEYL